MDKQIKKLKLFYSGELMLFAIAFMVLGFLELFRIIKFSERFQLIFKILTLIGASWLLFDFFWTLLSKSKRAKNSMLDKTMMVPLAVYLYAFDIAGFILNPNYGYYQIGVPIAFIYISCAYIFQSIYHYYHPIPLIQVEIDKALAEEAEQTISDVQEVEPTDEVEPIKEEQTPASEEELFTPVNQEEEKEGE